LPKLQIATDYELALSAYALQFFDDWVTLIRHTRIVPERLDEYLASLTAGGPLVPVKR
jgi:hypothetical protein